MKRRVGILIVGLLLVGATAACAGQVGAPGDAATGGLTQTDDGAGSVTVEATWVTPDHLAGDEKLRAIDDQYAGQDVLLLHVKMNTHSVDLSRYDLASLALLSAGGNDLRPIAYTKISDDQHHAEGALVFQRAPNSSEVTLTLRDIANVQARTLRWAPPP